MPAPKIIEDKGSYLVVEGAGGTVYNVAKSTYEQLYASDLATPPQDAAPAPEVTAPSESALDISKYPNTEDFVKGVTPKPASITDPVTADTLTFQEEQDAVDSMQDKAAKPRPNYLPPTIANQMQKVRDERAAAAAGSASPAPASPAPAPEKTTPATTTPTAPKPVEESQEVSDAVPTVNDTARSIREDTKRGKDIIDRVAAVDVSDAEKIVAIREAEDVALQRNAELEQAAWNQAVADGEELYQENKQMISDYINADVDQNRWWDSKSTGTKILAAISMALSGVGMAMKGQGDKNPAIDIINAAIDRDLNIQIEKISRLGKGVEMQSGLIADFWTQNDKKMHTFALAKAAALESAERKVKLVGQRSTSERVKLEAEELALALDKEKTGLLEGLRQVHVKEKQQDYANKSSRIGANASMRNARTSERELEWKMSQAEKAEKAAQATDDSNWMAGVAGGKVDANGRVLIENKDTRESVYKITTSTQKALNSVKRIRHLVINHGKEGWGNVKEEVKLEAYNLAIAALESVKGTPSEKDMVLYIGGMGIPVDSDGNVKPPNAWTNFEQSATTITTMEKVARNVREDANIKLKALPGGENWHFVEYAPVDLSVEERPPEGEIGIDEIISELDTEKENAGKTFTNTPDQKDAASKRQTERRNKIMETVGVIWKEIDAAYPDRLIVENKIAKLGALYNSLPPDSLERKYVAVEIKRMKDYQADPNTRLNEKQAAKDKKKAEDEAARKSEEKKRKESEGLRRQRQTTLPQQQSRRPGEKKR